VFQGATSFVLTPTEFSTAASAAERAGSSLLLPAPAGAHGETIQAPPGEMGGLVITVTQSADYGQK